MHGSDLVAVWDQLAPRFVGTLLHQPPAIIPPPNLHRQPAYVVDQPRVLPAVSPTARSSKTRGARQETDSLFGAGSSSDSDSDLPSSSQPRLVQLASPRKKRGVRYTTSFQPLAAVPIPSSSDSRVANLHPSSTTARRTSGKHPTNPDDTYGDPPNGEYTPRDGYRVYLRTHWLSWELPENRPEDEPVQPLPPIYALGTVVSTTPMTCLDREPPVVRRRLFVDKREGVSRDTTSATNDRRLRTLPTVGFDPFWSEVLPTKLGQQLERVREEERRTAEEKEKRRKAAQRRTTATGSEQSLTVPHPGAPDDKASSRDLEADLNVAGPSSPDRSSISPPARGFRPTGGSRMRIQSPE